MATGLFSVLYGQRPSRNPGNLLQGEIEENVAQYSGLRACAETYWIGAGFTSATRVVNAQTVSGGTLPLTLTQANTFTGVPMVMTYAYAIPNSGTSRSLSFSVYGVSQFGLPQREDVVFTNQAINQTVRQLGVRIFARVDAVIVTSRNSDVAAGDTLSIGPSLDNITGLGGVVGAATARLGSPIRIADATDVEAVQAVVFTGAGAGVLGATADARSGGLTLQVSVAEQSIAVSSAALNDTVVVAVNMIVRSSLGGTLGNNRVSGQKFFYIR